LSGGAESLTCVLPTFCFPKDSSSLETNTFGANRYKLAPLGLADWVVPFNHRGVKMARESDGARRFCGGGAARPRATRALVGASGGATVMVMLVLLLVNQL
jgi:methionine synthase I (cobalamin-dependent)